MTNKTSPVQVGSDSDWGKESPQDSDGDGMPDTWEDQYGLNSLVNDAAGDKDSDGYTNLREYQADTDPSNPNSKPKLKAMPWILLLLDD